MRSGFVIPMVLCATLAAACNDRQVSQIPHSGGGETFGRFDQDKEVKLDILFVIDDSGSMEDEQNGLAERFGQLTRALEMLPGGLPSIHIGVVSSGVGIAPFADDKCPASNDDGRFRMGGRNGSSCNVTGRFISDEKLPDGTRMKNYQGDLATAFSCAAKLGTAGCGFEQHLESMRLALDAPENAGFLRPDSYLTVIVLADEDDCSGKPGHALYDPKVALPLGSYDEYRCFEQGVICDEPVSRQDVGVKHNCRPNDRSAYVETVQRYVDFLKEKKGDRVITAAIIGNRDKVNTKRLASGATSLDFSCPEGNVRNAVPGIRLGRFVEAFGASGVVTSICANDYTPALAAIADVIKKKIQTQCVTDQVLAMAPDDPLGVPVKGGSFSVWCSVVDMGGGAPDKAIAACSDNPAKPCWNVVHNPATCETLRSPQNLELQVERDASQSLIGLKTEIRCLTPLPVALQPPTKPEP